MENNNRERDKILTNLYSLSYSVFVIIFIMYLREGQNVIAFVYRTTHLNSIKYQKRKPFSI